MKGGWRLIPLKRKWIKRRRKFFFIWIGLFLVFNTVGIGYGSWVGTIDVKGRITTGFIKTTVEECTVLNESCEQSLVNINLCGGANIEQSGELCDNKKVNIEIKDAYPGYSTSINYKFTNTGSIPVFPQPVNEVSSPVNINIIQPTERVIPKNSGLGTININVGEAKDINGTSYKFYLIFSNGSWNDVLEVQIDFISTEKAAVEDKNENNNNDANNVINNETTINSTALPEQTLVNPIDGVLMKEDAVKSEKEKDKGISKAEETNACISGDTIIIEEARSNTALDNTMELNQNKLGKEDINTVDNTNKNQEAFKIQSK